LVEEAGGSEVDFSTKNKDLIGKLRSGVKNYLTSNLDKDKE
jgi:hypothetical protein